MKTVDMQRMSLRLSSGSHPEPLAGSLVHKGSGQVQETFNGH